jgi:hypothetical protein
MVYNNCKNKLRPKTLMAKRSIPKKLFSSYPNSNKKKNKFNIKIRKDNNKLRIRLNKLIIFSY